MAKNMPKFKAEKDSDMLFPSWHAGRMTDKALKCKQMKGGKKAKKK